MAAMLTAFGSVVATSVFTTALTEGTHTHTPQSRGQTAQALEKGTRGQKKEIKGRSVQERSVPFV